MVEMKTINVTFTDEEHANLVKTKANISWHDFIILLSEAYSGFGVTVPLESIEKLADRKFSSPQEANRWLKELAKEASE